MGTIRLLVVDDHPVVRKGIKCVLAGEKDIEVVGEAGNSSTALQAAAECRPDVVCLDLMMPGSNGGAAVRRLKKACPQAKVIVLTAFSQEQYLFGAVEAGADAYLLKSVDMEELASTIRAVHNGERLLSPELVGKLIGRYQDISKQIKKQDNSLSDFEMRVLELVASGASNKQIGELLFMSEATIKRKLQDLCQKLGAVDRVQVVVEAINKGLI
ncbi:MAG: response regulator transcription factor [Chloroflexi bacterium]|nr:response regulator transcription factor [Chloroflexota bacterium]